jgi:hypothetical protein
MYSTADVSYPMLSGQYHSGNLELHKIPPSIRCQRFFAVQVCHIGNVCENDADRGSENNSDSTNESPTDRDGTVTHFNNSKNKSVFHGCCGAEHPRLIILQCILGSTYHVVPILFLR